MNTKTALVILVLVTLAMLLVIAIALGADRPGKPSGGVEGALKSLRSDRFLRLEGDVAADCPHEAAVARVASGATCTIVVPKSGLLSSPTRIVLESSAPVKFAIEPDRGPDLEMTLKTGKCTEAAIGRGGGTVRLSACAGLGGQCAVGLLQQGCPDD